MPCKSRNGGLIDQNNDPILIPENGYRLAENHIGL